MKKESEVSDKFMDISTSIFIFPVLLISKTRLPKIIKFMVILLCIIFYMLPVILILGIPFIVGAIILGIWDLTNEQL